MGSEWRETNYGKLSSRLSESNLVELCVDKNGIQTGPFGSQLHQKDYVESGIPIITVEHLAGNRISHQNLPQVSDEDWNRLERYQMFQGDIIFSRVGSVDRCALVGEEENGWLFSGRCLRVRIDSEKNHPKYLLYFLSLEGVKEYIRSIAVGATMPSLNTKILSEIKVYLPPLPEQKAIAHILGSLDDKIELNRKMNATLEGMAQALFKSWFVDFDPVIDNAIINGNPIPEEFQTRTEIRRQALANGTANREVAKDFPDKFWLTEEMGWVPEGWEVRAIGELTTELRRGISPKYVDENGVQVINQRCIRNHEIDFSVCRRHDSKKKTVDDRFLRPGDLLINSTGMGTLGRMAFVQFLNEPTVVDSHVTVVRPDPLKYLPTLFGLMMFSIENIIEGMGKGSTGQTELSRQELSGISLVVPGHLIQETASRVLDTFSLESEKRRQQTVNLINIRNELLPKLISGKKAFDKLVNIWASLD